MTLCLDPVDLRVIGSLIEKEFATPDYYPMTTAGLANACNQKTSREPVTAYTDAEIASALERLIEKGLVRERNPAGARAAKYAHRLGDSLGLSFGFSRSQLVILAVLTLRGAQTPGELNTRSERLRDPHDERDVQSVLEQLMSHERGPWVQELMREPGRRESRWIHLLGAEDTGVNSGAAEPGTTRPSSADAILGSMAADDEASALSGSPNVEELEQRVVDLEEKVAALLDRIDLLEGIFEP
ncbi:MAG: hypothetical protein ACI8PT_000039 [Gammaproteobacteria bacterium]|jgi:uncharacterized protein YceH (UPF0502 family)